MSRKTARLTRAGLFLLFVMALAVVTPMPGPALGAQRTSTAEVPPETKEHRDKEQVREGRGIAAPSHRYRKRSVGPRYALPEWPPQAVATRQVRPRSADAVPGEFVARRHAPAALQVFRR